MTKGCSQNDKRYVRMTDSYSEESQYSEDESERKYDKVTVKASFEFEPSEYSIEGNNTSERFVQCKKYCECSPTVSSESYEERTCNNLTCNVQRPIEYVPSRKSSRHWNYVKGDSIHNQPPKPYIWKESKSGNRKSYGDTTPNPPCLKPCLCKNVSTNVTSSPTNPMDPSFPFYNPNALFTVLVNKGTILINPKAETPLLSIKTGTQRSLPNLSVKQAKVQCTKPKFVDETTSIQQKESLENTVFFSASSASMSEPETKEFCGKNCESSCRGKCMCKNLFDGVMSLFSGDKSGNLVMSEGNSMKNTQNKPQKRVEPKGGRRRVCNGLENQCKKSCRFQKVCGKQSKHFTRPVCDPTIINPKVNKPFQKIPPKQSPSVLSNSRSVPSITSNTTIRSQVSFSNHSQSSIRSNTTNSLKMTSTNSTLFAKSQYKQLRYLKEELDRIKQKSGLYSKSEDSVSTVHKAIRPSSEDRSCGGEESEVCRCLKSSRSCRQSSTDATFGGYLATQFIGSNPNDSVELSSDQNYVFQSSNYRKHPRSNNVSAQRTTSSKEYQPSMHEMNYTINQDVTDTMTTYTSNDESKFEGKSSHKSFKRDRSADFKTLRIPVKTGSSTVITAIKKEEPIYDGYYNTNELFQTTQPHPNIANSSTIETPRYEPQNENYMYYESCNSKNNTIPKCSNMVQICKDHSVEKTFGYDPPNLGGKRTKGGSVSTGTGSQKVLRYLDSIHGRKSNQGGYTSKENLEKHRCLHRDSNGFVRSPMDKGDVSNGRYSTDSGDRYVNETMRKRIFKGYPVIEHRLGSKIESPQQFIERSYRKSILKRRPMEGNRILTPLESSRRIVPSPYMFNHKISQPYRHKSYYARPEYIENCSYDFPPKYYPTNRTTCTPSYTESGYNSVGERSYLTPSKTYSEHSSEQNRCVDLYDNLEDMYGEGQYAEISDEDSYPEN